MTLEQAVLAKLGKIYPNPERAINTLSQLQLLHLISKALGEIFPGDVEVHREEGESAIKAEDRQREIDDNGQFGVGS